MHPTEQTQVHGVEDGKPGDFEIQQDAGTHLPRHLHHADFHRHEANDVIVSASHIFYLLRISIFGLCVDYFGSFLALAFGDVLPLATRPLLPIGAPLLLAHRGEDGNGLHSSNWFP